MIVGEPALVSRFGSLWRVYLSQILELKTASGKYNPAVASKSQVAPLDPKPQPKRVLCVSWTSALATTRALMLAEGGYDVVSLCGRSDLERLLYYPNAVDLLILTHEVPIEEKRRALTLFRQGNHALVLSLLNDNQTKLPEADFGVVSSSPSDVVGIVKRILS